MSRSASFLESSASTVAREIRTPFGAVTHIPKRPGEPDITWADITKIQTHLGWTPKVSFEEGVRRILDNIDYWRGAPLWNPDSIADATKTWFSMLAKEP